MTGVAELLAGWACALEPTPADLALAERSLVDTLAVTLAARGHPVAVLAALLDEGPRWAVTGHVLDFDDLHLPSTAHVSVVCVPAVLAAGGGASAYLAAAGVMTRLGTALGWSHYAAGWHATCTAGALAAAAGAAVARGLGPDGVATALALAVPGAGGVQRAFGTDAKSLQVGFAVDAGLRAARLADAGAKADPAAVDAWLALVGGDPTRLDLTGPAVPGGLATKLHPCCYALQRPIGAVRDLVARGVRAADVERVHCRTPAATLVPLVHARPTTGLAARFSLPYAVATALLDGFPGRAAFTDAAVRRPAARRLVERVTVEAAPGGEGLLDGELAVTVTTADGATVSTTLRDPVGSPARPATPAELRGKLDDCLDGLAGPAADPDGWTWAGAADLLREHLPAAR